MSDIYEIPDDDAPAEEWGRLAVAIPGFPCHSVAQRRGMVGWLFGESADVNWPLDGLRAMFVVEKGVTTLYQVIESGGYPQHRMRNGRHEFIPDPDADATAGCLLRLLGDEWGAYHHDFSSHVWLTPYEVVLDRWLTPPRSSLTPEVDWRQPPNLTLGRACIAAAAALGRWPGGEG